MSPSPRIVPDQEQLRRLSRAMRQEADGKELRKELTRGLKEAVKPGVEDAKAAILAHPSQPGPREGGTLRQGIARQIKPEVRMSGRSAGVNVRVRSRNMPRGFRLAARCLNREQAWRHPVFGNREVWVEQRSPRPGWFDRAMSSRRDEALRVVKEAVDDMAARIAARSRP